MKNFISLCLLVIGFNQVKAQNTFEFGKPVSNISERKIKPNVDRPILYQNLETTLSKDNVFQTSLAKANKQTNTIHFRSANNQQIEKLDSIVTTQPNGDFFSKQIFSYNEDNYFTKSENFFWNFETSEWDLVQIYQYEYDDNNRLIAQIQKEFIDFTGSKTEFTYNNQNEVVSTKYSSFENDQFYYLERMDHQYLNGNIVAEDFYQSVNGTDQWVKTFFGTAVYDNLNRQIGIEQYIIDNGQNIGLSKANYQYYADTTNKLTLYEYFEWTSNNTWFPNQRIEQTFDNGYITEQKLLVWNYDLESWTGDQTHKTLFTYDELWRQTSEIAYYLNQSDFTTFDQRVAMFSTYTPGENNTTIQHQQTFERVNNTDILRTNLYKHYNSQNSLSYRKEYSVTNNIDYPLYEEVYSYDSNNNLISTKIYNFEGQTRLASFRYDQQFDNQNLITNYTAYNGFGDDSWDDFMKYDYINNSGFRVSTLGYIKQNGQWLTNFGNSIDIDNAIQSSLLILPSNYPSPYKIINTKNYNTDGNTGWLIDTSNFYYSLIENLGTNDLSTQKIKVYPNPTSDFITIDKDRFNEIKIYDLTGRIVLTSKSNRINVKSLINGIYIINVDGITVKLIKK